jgi:hypothetical protein
VAHPADILHAEPQHFLLSRSWLAMPCQPCLTASDAHPWAVQSGSLPIYEAPSDDAKAHFLQLCLSDGKGFPSLRQSFSIAEAQSQDDAN